MKTIAKQFKAQAIQKAISLSAEAALAGHDTGTEVRVWAWKLEKELRKEQRSALAAAVKVAMDDPKAAPAALQAAWDWCSQSAVEASKAVSRVAAISTWPTFRLEVSPVNLYLGKERGAFAPRDFKEFVTGMRGDHELLTQLYKQAKSAEDRHALAPLAAAVRSEYGFVIKPYTQQLFFLGKYAKDDHAVVLANGQRVNKWAWESLQTVKDPAAGSGAQLRKGLASIAQFAMEQSVIHAHFAEVESPAFWVAGGHLPTADAQHGRRVEGVHSGRDSVGGISTVRVTAGGGDKVVTRGVNALHDASFKEEDPYPASEDLLIRAPFFNTTNVGLPSLEEAEEAIALAKGDFASTAEQLAELARMIDAELGGGDNYWVRGAADLAAVEAAALQRLADKEAERKAEMAWKARQRLLAKVERVLAEAVGLDAAQRAQYVKAATVSIQGFKEALKDYRELGRKQELGQLKAEEQKHARIEKARRERAAQEAAEQLAAENAARYNELAEAAAAKRAAEAAAEAQAFADLEAKRIEDTALLDKAVQLEDLRHAARTAELLAEQAESTIHGRETEKGWAPWHVPAVEARTAKAATLRAAAEAAKAVYAEAAARAAQGVAA